MSFYFNTCLNNVCYVIRNNNNKNPFTIESYL